MRTRLALLLLLWASIGHAAAPPPERFLFETHVRPILRAHCLECHGEGGKPKGRLDLRLRRLIAAGGDSGPAVVPGQPEASPLYLRIRDHEMPIGKVKLKAGQIERIRRWIAAGAATARPEPAQLAPGLHIGQEERNFWSFRPIRRPTPPPVRQPELVRTPVDAFLLAQLEAAGLSFAGPADRHAFLRRVSFDLIGLPPTPKEVEAFLTDRRVDAHERLIDRLLASPAYGERWGRHWLDAAGYADSHGYTGDDPVRPYAWKYRDHVLRAFNADQPFDQFILEQLAGDELVETGRKPEDIEKLIATGFLRTAPDGTASLGVDTKSASNQMVADTVQIVSTALLGLTVQCAQCHNHRYDPIPQEDYYRLRAIFEPAYDVKRWRPPPARLISLMTPADRQKGLQIEKAAHAVDAERLKKLARYIEATFQKQLKQTPASERAAVEQAYRTPEAKRSAAQQKLLQQHPSVNVSAGSLYLYDPKAADDLAADAQRAAKIRATRPVEDFIDALTEPPGPVPTTFLFHRGDPDQPAGPVAPGGLSILAGLRLGDIPAKDPTRSTTGRRLAFARRLTSGRHPLTARVLVNRVWMHHFGKGIVGTPGDLGFLGDRPTHPELLDFLAWQFQRNWSLKRLHRLILCSTAYRQSAVSRDARAVVVDPDVRLLWRMPVRRLEAEAVRDAVLAVSGQINRRPFGPAVPVTPDNTGQIVLGVDRRDAAGYLTGKGTLAAAEFFRRSVYVQVRRSMPLTVLETFDAPVMSPNCQRRTFSTVAPQALLMMNSEFVVQSAEAFARRVRQEAGVHPADQVRRAFLLALSQPADQRQEEEALAYWKDQAAWFRLRSAKSAAPAELQALATLCHALLASNAFLYTE